MTIIVESDRTLNITNSHHVSLSDGTTTVPIILASTDGKIDPYQYTVDAKPDDALQIRQGELEYADLHPNLTSIAQKDFSFGRGFDDFDEQRAGYKDSHLADTTRRTAMYPAGFYSYAKSVRNWAGNWARYGTGGSELTYVEVEGDPDDGAPIDIPKWATPFVPSATFSCAWAEVVAGQIRARSMWELSPGNYDLLLKIYSDVAGAPGTLLSSGTTSLTEGIANQSVAYYQTVRGAMSAYSLQAGTTYWFVVELWQYASMLMAGGTGLGSKVYDYTAPAGWDSCDEDIIFRITDADNDYKPHFQLLKGSVYVGMNYLNETTAPAVYKNGWQGRAEAGSTSTTINVNGTPFTADEYIGAIAVCVLGKGSDSERPVRMIEDNANNTLVFTTDPWDFTPDTTSIFAIVATEKFSAVTGHSWASGNKITDVCSIHNTIYFAMGASKEITALTAYDSSGTWTYEFDAMNSNCKGDLVLAYYVAGKSFVGWMVKSNSNFYHDEPTDGTSGGVNDMSATTYTSFAVGDISAKPNRLIVFGDTPHVWVLKEDKPYEIVGTDFYEFRVGQLAASKDYRNGRAAVHHDEYLYMSFEDGLMRWHNSGELRNMGPERLGPEGLPPDRRGNFTALVGWKNLVIGAYDAGKTGYSSILAWNGYGWHELFRAPFKGKRILNLFVQTISGECVDRLWFGMGSDVLWIPLAEYPDALTDIVYNFYPFVWSSIIETANIYYTFKEEEKFYNKVSIVDEYIGRVDDWEVPDLYGSDLTIDYASDFNSYYALGLTTTGITEATIGDALIFKYLKIKFSWFHNNNRVYIKKIKQWTLQLALLLQQKWNITLQFKVRDHDVDLLNQAEPYQEGQDLIDQLLTWADDKQPVVLRHYDPTLDHSVGFIDYPSIRTTQYFDAEGRLYKICSLVFRQI